MSLAAPNLENQEYTITDNPVTYQVPEFVSDPNWCAVTYSFTITLIAGDAAVIFNSDESIRTFTFDYTASLDLSGLTEK